MDTFMLQLFLNVKVAIELKTKLLIDQFKMQKTSLSEFIVMLNKFLQSLNLLFNDFDRTSFLIDVIFYNFIKNLFTRINLHFLDTLFEVKNNSDWTDEHNSQDKYSEVSDNVSVSKSDMDMSLGSSDSDEDHHPDQLLIDIDNNNMFVNYQKLIEACYSDLLQTFNQLTFLADYQSEVSRIIKSSKKFVLKIVELDSIQKIQEMAENFDIEEEFQQELQFIKLKLNQH